MIRVVAIMLAAVLMIGALPAQPVTLQPVGLLLPPTVPELVYFFALEGDGGARVTGSWVVEDVGGVAPAGYVIDAATITVEAGGEASFSLSRPTNGWPLGRYRLDVTLNERLVRSEWFVIQQ